MGTDTGRYRGNSSSDYKKLKTAAVFLTKSVVYFYYRKILHQGMTLTHPSQGVVETGSAFSGAILPVTKGGVICDREAGKILFRDGPLRERGPGL